MIVRRMDCAEIRDALLAGNAPADPAAEAHLRECEACAELFADRGSLARALSKGEAHAGESAELWASVEGALRADTGPRAWLRSRSTPLRVLIAFAAALAVVALGGRPAGGDSGLAERPTGFIVAFALGALACLSVLVAPLGRRQPSPGVRSALVLGALSLPLAYAVVPRTALAASAASAELGFVAQAFGCFVYGVVLALPFAILVLLLERSDRPRLGLVAGFGAVAGLVANTALALHCPNTEPAHLALGHATVGGALAAFGVLVAIVVARRSNRVGSR